MANFEKRKNGWTVRFYFYNNGEAKQVRLSGFETKRAAELAYLNYIECPKNIVTAKNITFAQLAKEYLNAKKNDVRESSYYDIANLINNRIVSFFADQKVCKITPRDIQEFQDSISDYSYKYKKNIRMYLDSILSFGQTMYGIISISNKVKKPRDSNLEVSNKKIQVWSQAEFSAFISSINSNIYKLFFSMLFYSGMRKGECLALHWNDIDFAKNTVKINKSITRKGQAAWSENPPKNASSIREIAIPDKIAQELANIRPNNNNNGYIFTRNDGTAPLAERSIDRQFLSGIEKSGNPKIKIHDLRHSHASILLSKGLSILAISKRLGHSSTKETLDTYSHLMPQDNDKLIATINSI